MDTSCFGTLGSYKGVNGKIGVIGGSFEYTGAPYYAAISSLRAGGDLAHIFCTKSAGIPIKSYSPEIIVHPTLASSWEEPISDFSSYSQSISELTTKWYPALHSLIIGPGLGRDPFLVDYLVPMLVSTAMAQGSFYIEKLLVIDADGINLLTKHKSLVNNYKNAVITPNTIEFNRLWETYMNTQTPEIFTDESWISWRNVEDPGIKPAADLARQMGVCLFVKGKVDVISDGNRIVCVGQPGSHKRCGGQGDVLVALLLHFYGQPKEIMRMCWLLLL